MSRRNRAGRMDPRLKLRHIRCFLAIVQNGGIVRAAEALNLTQPAVSRTLKELETILGHDLIDHARRGANLTRAGKVFQEHARASLSTLSNAVDLLRTGTLAPEVLVVGALPNVCAALLPATTRDFKAAHPNVTLRLLTGTNADLLAQLGSGAIDVVIGRLADPESMRGLSFEHLYNEPLVFACLPDHPLAGGRSFPAGRIGDFPIILPLPGTIIRTEVDRFLQGQGVPAPRDLIETISFDFGRAYLDRSHAIWVVPQGIVAAELAAGSLAALPAGSASLSGPVGITVAAEREIALNARHYLDILRAHNAAQYT